MTKPGPVLSAAALVAVTMLFLLTAGGINRSARGFFADWLTRELHSPVTVRSVRLNPWRQRVSFRGLVLAQPSEFGPGPAFRVEEGYLRVNILSIFSPRLVFEDISLQGVAIRLARNPGGRCNTAVFFPSSCDPPGGEEEPSQEVLIRRGAARSIDCSYIDYRGDPAEPGVPAEIRLREGELEVSDLLFSGEVRAEGRPTRAVLTGRVEQGEGPPARLGLAARSGELGAGTPRLRAALRVIGVKTETLDSFFPPPGPRIVGEEAFDLSADLDLSPAELSGSLTLADWTGQEESVTVRGHPAAPEMELSAGLSLVLRHYGDRAGGWAEHYTGRSGGRIVTTVVSTVAAAGQGVARAAVSLGSGLFHFGEGIWRRDAAHAARGMTEAGTGAAAGAVQTVTGPGEALVAGTGLRRAIRGEGTGHRWWSEAEARWSRDWAAARRRIFGESTSPGEK